MGVRKYDPSVIIELYGRYHSEDKVASEVGCGHTTVWRILKRNGIERTGHQYKGNGGGGSECKLSDDDLLRDVVECTREEIASKYGINVCNVDRKLRRLGLKAKRKRVPTTGGRYVSIAKANGVPYEYGITLDSVIKKYRGICQICGKPVDIHDKDMQSTGNQYPSIDHIVPMTKGGAHTWENVQLVHKICNVRKANAV